MSDPRFSQVRAIRRLTTGSANDQLLYFTTPSLTADDGTLVFLSDRTEGARDGASGTDINLYALNRLTGETRRLTDNHEGYLRSYVYFDGHPYRGLGMASPCLHAPSGDVYFIQGREVRCVNAHTGDHRTLATLPDDHVTGFTHVSDDNTRICVPTIHESAFADIEAIDATVQRLGLSSHVRVFDTHSGAQVDACIVERGWVTHVQFQPGSGTTILFNHEWPADGGIRRVWLWDGQEIRRMRHEGTNANGTVRHRDDWVCHEVWSPDGRFIFYHGKYAAGRGPHAGCAFIGRVEIGPGTTRATDAVREIPFPLPFQRYGHFTIGPGSTFVSDGYAAYPAYTGNAAPRGWGGAWLSLLHIDWERGTQEWEPLAPHGSSWTSQDAHPHPVSDHAGSEVLFTSDRDGTRAVYAVSL